MGFTRVYDYVAGKADWGSFGLPLEGEADSRTRVGCVARADVPTCLPDDLVSEVAKRVADEWRICVVTNENLLSSASSAEWRSVPSVLSAQTKQWS